MLTKTDLREIKKIVREEVETEAKTTRRNLKSDLFSYRVRVQEDIRDLSDRTKNLEIAATKIEKEIKKGFRKIEKKLDKTSDFLDKENLKTLKRVKKIEKHTQLAPIS